MEGLRDLVDLSFATMEERETRSVSLHLGRRSLYIGPLEIEPLCAEKLHSGTTAMDILSVPRAVQHQRQRYLREVPLPPGSDTTGDQPVLPLGT